MTATSSWSDPALVVGQSFTDTAAQITITPISITATNALVAVTIGTAGCTRANPGLVDVAIAKRRRSPQARPSHSLPR